MSSVKLARRTTHVLCRRYSVVQANKKSLWTADRIVKSPFRDVEIPKTTIPDHIWENLNRWPEKTAVVCGVTGHSYTYHQVYKYSRNFAAKLRNTLKIRDGDVVLIMMGNCPEYAVAILGALQAGAQVSTVNPIYTSHEVHRQITLSNPKVIIGVQDTLQAIKGALELSKLDLPVITEKALQELAYNDSDHDVLSEVKQTSSDVALLPYSSGTTGLPKGVELMHSNIVANCVQQNVEGVRQYEETTGSHQDSVMAVLPFYHSYGLSVLLLQKMSVGGKLVTLPRFQPKLFLSALREHRISLLYAAPPMVLFLASNDEVNYEHLQTLRAVMCGAAPLPLADVQNVLQKAKGQLDFLQVYGLTETSPLATTMVAGSQKYSSVGFGLSNTELKIVDGDSKELAQDQVGELLIRGPQVMKGYRNNEEATRAAITHDGWFRTGDLASIADDGTVTIADRIKELIKVKGYQVPPAELEGVIKEYPSVLDVAVVGVPDARSGEAPKAFVVLKQGHSTEGKQIIDFVSERVAAYKRLKEVMFIDALPKNPSGKILRRVLKEQYC